LNVFEDEDFDFSQICPNFDWVIIQSILSNYPKFWIKILGKFIQILPNLPKFAQILVGNYFW